jgi:hypothetical protein
MRRWGRTVPIYKASRPNHELGIQIYTTLLRKARKEVIWGQRHICKEEEWRKRSLEEKRVLSTLDLKGKLRSKLILGTRIHGQDFLYNLINEFDE